MKFKEQVIKELQEIQKIGGHEKVPSKAYQMTDDVEFMNDCSSNMSASECVSLLLELSL